MTRRASYPLPTAIGLGDLILLVVVISVVAIVSFVTGAALVGRGASRACGAACAPALGYYERSACLCAGVDGAWTRLDGAS